MAVAILFASCSSTTLIQTTPPGAKIYLNEECLGTSPYTYSDKKILGSVNQLKIEKEGFQTLNTSLTRNETVDVGAIIGGVFFLVPFLWTLQYKPVHTYELVPLQNNSITNTTTSQTETVSKTERLTELQKPHDEKSVSKEEYEKQVLKISIEQ